MATFHKVITRITDRGAFINYGGEVTSEQKPQNTYKETKLADIYEDYFATHEEAQKFIKVQSKYL